MEDFVFIFFTILVVVALIFFLYQVMVSAEKEKKDEDLQITSKEILEQITILQKQKRHNIVEQLSKKYLEKKPDDTGVRTILVRALFDVQKHFEAIDQAQQVLKHQPGNIDIKIILANCYIETDKPMKAIEIFKEIHEKDETNVIAIRELANLYLKTNQKKSAIKMFKKLEELIESNHEKAKSKMTVAEIYIEFGDFTQAIQEYEGILEIYPDNIGAKRRLAELHILCGNYETVIEIASNIAETEKDDDKLWALTQLMDVYHAMQDFEKAMQYANLLKENPLSDEIFIGKNIAQILKEEGNIESSIDVITELITKNPEDIGLKKELANAQISNKNFEAALAIYKEILELVKADKVEQIHFEMSNIYSDWAIQLYKDENNAECFKKFSIALKYSEKNPDIYYRLANVNKLIKNYNEAISQYKKAIELAPTTAEYYWAIAECYKEIDSIYEEKKVLLEFLKHDKTSTKVFFRLGEIYSSQNDNNAALDYLQKAIDLDDKFIDPKRKKALILEHLGRIEEAVELYKNILQLDPENEEIANNLKMLT